MRKISVVLSALILIISSSSFVYADASETVTVDFDKTYQTIDGFGASYTWYSERLINNNSAQDGLDWIFSEDEFNILRFRDLNRVGAEHEKAENGYTAYYAYYSAAIERGIDPLVLVTSWGDFDRDLEFLEFVEAPNGRTYYTLKKDENGEYMYQALAEFFVQSVKYFFDAGIPVDCFSISNEVELQERREDENGNRREAAGFFLGQDEDEYHCAYWKAHIAVYKAFNEAFGEFAPRLLGAETMAATPELLHSYLDPIIENCPESLEIVGHHLYGTDRSEHNLTAVGEEFADYTIWMTEWYNNNFFDQAEVVIDELVYENVTAYLYWSGVWAPDMGICLIEVGSNDPDAQIQRMGNHYIMQHYSKFIKRGYQRVDVSEELNTKFAAFKSPDEGILVVIAMNPSKTSDFMTLDIGNRKILSSKVYQSTEAENRFANKYMVDLDEYEDELFLPARSLTTIILDLEPNPEYNEVIEEEPVNPYVSVKKDFSPIVLILVISAVTAFIIIIAILIIIKRR